MKTKSIDLEALYDEYNQQYFGGELQPVDSIYWSPRLKPALGIANLIELDGTSKITIGISSLIADDPERVRRVMTHEQVHVLGYQRFLKTGNERYLDLENYSQRDGFTVGHGDFFEQVASVLNATYPELNISAADDSFLSDTMKKGSFHYIETKFLRGSEIRTSIFYTDRAVGQRRICDIQERIEELYGKQSLISIEMFKTKDPIVTNFSRLTSKFDLRINQVPIHYSPEVLTLLNDVISTSLDRFEYEIPSDNYQKTLANTLVRHRKTKHLNFSDYMMNVVAGDANLSVFLAKSDVATYMNLNADTRDAIYSEWKSIRFLEIRRSTHYYETLSLENLDHTFELSALRTLVDFGVNRIKIPDYMAMLRDDLIGRYPVTLLDEVFASLEESLIAGVKHRQLESRSLYIGMDKDSYVVGCVLSRLNDGHRVYGKDIKVFESNWDAPSISNVASSQHLRNDIDTIFSDAMPLFLEGALTQSGRKFDGIVSGWGTFISRGVTPSQIANVISQCLEKVSMENRSYGRLSASLGSEFKKFVAAMFDASISHCYGGGEMRAKRSAKNNQAQMDIFG